MATSGEPKRDAIRLWKDLITLNPNIPQPYNYLGMASSGMDDLDAAIMYYNKSLVIDPTQFHARLSLARIYRWRGQLEESTAILEQLLAEDSDRLDVRLELGRVQLQNWRFDQADEHWKLLLAASPTTLEYQMSMATVHLNNNQVEEAIKLTRQILEAHPRHVQALTLMADALEYGEDPKSAIPTLKQLIEACEDVPELLHQARTRLVRLYVRLHRREPFDNPLIEAIGFTEQMAEADPLNTDTRLLLGELHSMNKNFEAAASHLLHVLEQLNPNNQRARRGLFEVYLGQRNHAKAWEQLEFIRNFNPNDPYYHYRLARYEAGRGRFYAAYEALDELERRGRQGAVAVLLYHAISPSDWTATPSIRRLQDQLNALQEAGYRFITPEEMPAYLAERSAVTSEDGDLTIDKVAMVTFDDALRSSMRYGTQVADALDVRFTQFVITGFTERGDPFVSTWDELREWQKTGRWSFHSQLYLAEERAPINEEGSRGLPLANRLWVEDENRLETVKEYEARIRFEYPHSQKLLRENLGTNGIGHAIAYPLGELGQETTSNVGNAIPLNLAVGLEHYKMGFLQSPFGYAVVDDHPMLYQRHELHRSAEGPEALAHVMENHPVLLAERMRAEFAALEGKQGQARRSLRNLRTAGYPEESMKRVETYVKDRTARRFAAPPAAERADKGHISLAFSNPYLGGNMLYFRDNIGRRNWRQHAFAGMNVTHRMTLEGRAGWGQLQQDSERPAINGEPQPRIDLEVDQQLLGLRGSYVITERTMIAGEVARRSFSGDADWDPMVYALEGFFRPLGVDFFVRYEHDAVESAYSITEEVTQDLIAVNTIVPLTDWWDLWISGLRYDFSDDNERSHLTLASQWMLWERIGLYGGLRYGYVTADEERFDYWTPYRLHRYYLEALLRRNYFRVYYNVGARVGLGRQSVRPEAQEAFEANVERARRLGFDAGEGPSTDWEPILGLFATTRVKLGSNWEANGEVSYSKLPDYDELNISAGIKYQF